MKHLITFVVFGALLIFLGSCSKKERPAVDDDNLLIGTWEAVRAVERGYIGDQVTYEIDTENPDDHFTLDIKIQFIDKSSVRITGDDIDGTIETTYSLSNGGKTLSVKDPEGASTIIQIKKLTATDMEWVIEGEDFLEGDEVSSQAERYETEIHLKKVN
ncbi:lipocalin family protein [Parapedobacter indicus]|uniref:Lipocalin-like domain-containing protein n=1 Tax=Parapedobacter indicus TaxID=1477437 RepID=A0A1I3SJY1_9SPHI|nr:lipocalin family protein [Parapedobacter indicus]PPK99783.1 hypothetical protein CLV26_111116 [Parapedobacter indicus]SFJ58963.1 hypothetical protein SAMN05444682_11183 [Parapedobacter indicus]